MTTPKYTCEECRYDGGWHLGDPDNPVRCPNRAMTVQLEHARDLAKLANQNAWAAAQQIMRDTAQSLPQFNANVIRDKFEHAGIPTSLRGSAFTWAAKQGLIVRDAARVQSTEATTRHEIAVWRSLVYRGRQTA